MAKIFIVLIGVVITGIGVCQFGGGVAAAIQSEGITIRTENFPRPPYSGATYYIYERGGEVICTKLEVCNKYNDCETEYKKGVYKDEYDIQTGEPYGKTAPVVLSRAKQKKHVCLTKFKLSSK